MLFGIEFSQRLHQQLVNVRVVLLFLQQVAVDSRGSHTCALVTKLCLGCKAIVKRNPAQGADEATLHWTKFQNSAQNST